MKSTEYSEKVLDHFRNPRNVGTLEGENVAVGRVGNPVCGDLMEVFIRVENDRIVDAKFRTFGCGSAIATSSMTTELVKGRTLDEAMRITREDVAEELDGLPPIKMHCSNLAADALHEAIKNYRAMQAEKRTVGETAEEPRNERERPEITGKEKFVGKGVFLKSVDFESIRGQRVLVIFDGSESVETAIRLTEYTDRVVLITADKNVQVDDKLAKRLDESRAKVIMRAEVLEIRGEDEVEQVVVHDLDEDDIEDIDEDTIDEVLRFERKPLEVLFKVNGKELLIILIAFKSKGVFITANFHKYQSIALANRKKLYGQAKKVRERLDLLLNENPEKNLNGDFLV